MNETLGLTAETRTVEPSRRRCKEYKEDVVKRATLAEMRVHELSVKMNGLTRLDGLKLFITGRLP